VITVDDWHLAEKTIPILRLKSVDEMCGYLWNVGYTPA